MKEPQGRDPLHIVSCNPTLMIVNGDLAAAGCQLRCNSY